MKKKGVSPLIATVLIIGFTIALAAIIITWSTGFTKKMQATTEETSTTQISCATDVIFKISSVCTMDDVVYKITVQNDGKEDIKNWKVRSYKDANSVETSNVTTTDPSVPAFGIKQIEIKPALTPIKKFEIFPVIEKVGKDITCSSNTDSYGDEYSDNTINKDKNPCAT